MTVPGKKSGFFTVLRGHEYRLLEEAIPKLEDEGMLPEWFIEKYDGQVRSLSPLALAYFIDEIMPGGRGYGQPVILREYDYDKEKRLPIMHQDVGLPPVAQFGDPDVPLSSWEQLSQSRLFASQLRNMLARLKDKLGRRWPEDIESCNMAVEKKLREPFLSREERLKKRPGGPVDPHADAEFDYEEFKYWQEEEGLA